MRVVVSGMTASLEKGRVRSPGLLLLPWAIAFALGWRAHIAFARGYCLCPGLLPLMLLLPWAMAVALSYCLSPSIDFALGYWFCLVALGY